jgi:hypothetical protein
MNATHLIKQIVLVQSVSASLSIYKGIDGPMSTLHTRRRTAAGGGRGQSLVDESNESVNPRERSGLKPSVDWNRFTILATLLLVLLVGRSSPSIDPDRSENEGSVGQTELDKDRSLELQKQKQKLAMTPGTCSITHFDVTFSRCGRCWIDQPRPSSWMGKPKKWTEGEFLDRNGALSAVCEEWACSAPQGPAR